MHKTNKCMCAADPYLGIDAQSEVFPLPGGGQAPASQPRVVSLMHASAGMRIVFKVGNLQKKNLQIRDANPRFACMHACASGGCYYNYDTERESCDSG